MAADSPALCDVSSSLLNHNREAGLRHTRPHGANAGGTGISTTAIVALPASLTEQFKIFKRKAVILVLLWSFSSNTVFYFFVNQGTGLVTVNYIPASILAVLSLLLCPLLGWLADVHFSRYRVIKWSLRIMWLASVLFCLASILVDYFSPTITTVMMIIFYIALAAGLGAFHANIIQFGIDQLVAASSSEISSLISWYVWLWLFSEIPVMLSLGYTQENLFKSVPLLLPLPLTISVSSDYIFNSCLIKEPPSNTLIYKVLHYAAKNKYPRLRSAFTYWDDKRFSRIDLGKSKYGGPFTTEEVENVKTFWRLFGSIVVGSIFIGLIMCTPAKITIYHHLHGEHNSSHYYKYYVRNFLNYRLGIFLVALIPLYKFIVDPFLRKCYCCMLSIKSGVPFGIMFYLVSLTAYIVIEGVGRHLTQEVYYSNITCPMDSNIQDNITLPLNQMWTMIPNGFDGVGEYFFLLAAVKFTYAQSPYSMKSLMLGLIYGCLGLSVFLSFALLLLVQYAIKKWAPPQYGCEMWYLLFVFIVNLVIAAIVFTFYRAYKLRFRDDTLKNEQMFAIRYYSQGDD